MNRLLLTIDFVNDIVHPDGAIPSCAPLVAAGDVIARANEAIAWARSRAVPVVHVRVGFDAAYVAAPAQSPVFGGVASRSALVLGRWGTEFHAALDVRSSDALIVKPRISPFYATGLEALLRAREIQQIVVCGVATNYAVEAAVRDGHDRDYRMVVVADACASHSVEAHQAAIGLAIGRLSRVLRAADLLTLEP